MKKWLSLLCIVVFSLNPLCGNFLFALSEEAASMANYRLTDTSERNESKEESIIPLNNKYGWNSVSKWKKSRTELYKDMQIYKLYEEKKQSHLANCLKSVLAPGWGHFSAHSYTKGEVLLGMQIFLLGSSIYFYDKAMDNYDGYRNAHQIDEMHQYYNDANSSYRTSQLLLGFCAVVWGYTILDVVPATENYNRNLWEGLRMEYKDKEIFFTPQGVNIKF